ncbi:5-formyltetrahydrofolate cyclo-ligase [Spirosoma agri]|uniref:5-formyltetrahydrofolate cyclo-ligase n=1 Tax=Spirosoma agri TaxID=1987381 RepID=A0A6M0IMJ1_9BACT|nr:5-formyltetrahydrofolate cyclo-ligase [Spirosoma agri]NEU68621.1 5-formyltetrahydrofolate cyclo-ligase [Spirosoma agri]
MTKAELRRQYLALRKGLSAEVVTERSQQICQRFFEQDWLDGEDTVHVFLPIQRQNEVNTWPIVHRIWHDFPQKQVVVSVTDPEAHRLTHYALTPDTRLIDNRWGIPEPIAPESAAISTKHIDAVLVPLLLFDQLGHRIGYGGGFYDRFLADCRPDCLSMGLSLFEPVDKIESIEPTDVPMTGCVTPDRIWFFSK